MGIARERKRVGESAPEGVTLKVKPEQAGVVRLEWTVSDSSFEEFIIERSLKDTSFEVLATFDGGMHRYQFFDESAPSGFNYYRIRGRKFDSAKEFKKVRIAYCR